MLELQHHGTPPVDMPLETSRELLPKQQSNWYGFIAFAVATSVLFVIVYRVYQEYGPGRTLSEGEGRGINHKGEFYKPRLEAKSYPPVK